MTKKKYSQYRLPLAQLHFITFIFHIYFIIFISFVTIRINSLILRPNNEQNYPAHS